MLISKKILNTSKSWKNYKCEAHPYYANVKFYWCDLEWGETIFAKRDIEKEMERERELQWKRLTKHVSNTCCTKSQSCAGTQLNSVFILQDNSNDVSPLPRWTGLHESLVKHTVQAHEFSLVRQLMHTMYHALWMMTTKWCDIIIILYIIWRSPQKSPARISVQNNSALKTSIKRFNTVVFLHSKKW